MTVQLCAYVWLAHRLSKCFAHNSDTSFIKSLSAMKRKGQDEEAAPYAWPMPAEVGI
jgi:hypothetical protein